MENDIQKKLIIAYCAECDHPREVTQLVFWSKKIEIEMSCGHTRRCVLSE